jgi:uncharacterized membrane protein YedE/YeeE
MRFILVVAGLVVAGILAVWLVKALFGLFFYLLVGALVVGGAVYVYGRVRRGITSGRYRVPRLPR